jgi:hypothetical protein
MNLIISLGCRTEYSDPIGLCVKTMRLLDRKTERTENAADGDALLTSLLKGPTSSVLCSSAFSATRGSVEMHVPNRRRAVQIPMSMAIFFCSLQHAKPREKKILVYRDRELLVTGREKRQPPSSRWVSGPGQALIVAPKGMAPSLIHVHACLCTSAHWRWQRDHRAVASSRSPCGGA